MKERSTTESEKWELLFVCFGAQRLGAAANTRTILNISFVSAEGQAGSSKASLAASFIAFCA